MINNLVVFCQNNHFRLLGVLCLCIAFFVILSWVSYSCKNIKPLATGLVFVATITMFFTKVFMWIWLVAELVVILDKVLVF